MDSQKSEWFTLSVALDFFPSSSALLYMHVHVTLFTLPLLSFASSIRPWSPTTAATTLSAASAGPISCSCALWTALIAAGSSCQFVGLCIHASLAWSFDEIEFYTSSKRKKTRLLQRADRHRPRTPHIGRDIRLQFQSGQPLHHGIHHVALKPLPAVRAGASTAVLVDGCDGGGTRVLADALFLGRDRPLRWLCELMNRKVVRRRRIEA